MSMGISTVSFNQARIYKYKMFFTLNGKDSICTAVFDHNGNNLFTRRSYKSVKNEKEDFVVISRRNEYECHNNIIFEIIERLYDKTGQFLRTQKHIKIQ